MLEAQEAAIAATQVGVRYREVHLVAARILAQGLCDFGLLKGDVDGLVEQGAHAVFFPHGVGHLLGLDVHDMELFGDRVGYPAGRSRASQFGLSFLRLDRDLEAGMVVTIEPGIYVVPAVLRDPVQRDRHGDSVRWARAEEWIGFGGVRIEDDVLVGPDGPQVLSSALPRAREAIEALVGSGLSPARRLGLA